MTRIERGRAGLPNQALSRLAKGARLARELGPKGTTEHALRRLASAIRGRDSFQVFLIVLSQPRFTARAAAAAKDHTFRFASRADLEALAGDPLNGVQRWDLDSFDRGSRCLLQLDGERLVGYSWVATAPLIELMWGVHFNLPDDMAYNYNGFTAPAYRGTAFQGLRHLKVLERMRAEGKQRLFAYVDDLNSRSLRGVEKSGYQRVGVLTGVKRRGRLQFSLEIDPAAWSMLVRSGPSQHHPPAASKIVQ